MKLVRTAALAGWSTGWQWDEGSGGIAFVTVHVAARDTR
ncbi:Activator of Hsp90 ATPase -like protein OS=Streptomyces microflavus OX=1919 GN=Smic_80590 PE=4 SV=1 [Streptomyces microflavus]